VAVRIEGRTEKETEKGEEERKGRRERGEVDARRRGDDRDGEKEKVKIIKNKIIVGGRKLKPKKEQKGEKKKRAQKTRSALFH
jgi:hypothetical protein